MFFRGVVTNLFNHQRIDGFNTTILRRDTNSAYAAFNPFTETPVQGVHWDYGPQYRPGDGPERLPEPRASSTSPSASASSSKRGHVFHCSVIET